jgi:hypothetical protein
MDASWKTWGNETVTVRPRRDALVLCGLLIGLAAVTAVSLATTPIARPGAPVRAPWCSDGQSPEFHFGFADLSQALGPRMGSPLECEHGDSATGNDLQVTTTGMAVYSWCTNTSGFVSADSNDYWALVPTGLTHWTSSESRPDLPIVREPDLRHPCPA